MFYFYYASLIVLVPGLLFSIYASIRVKTTFNKYNKQQTENGLPAFEVARILLSKKNCNEVSVSRISGNLTDNFNPQTNVLSLSDSTYNSSSVASVGVCAHEVGHACQHNENYFMIKVRTAIVPVVNFGTRLAFPLAIIGVFLEYLSSIEKIGTLFIIIGITLYSLSFIFCLITLPTEINASRRAKKMLLEYNLVTKREANQIGSVLYSASLTYFASLLVSFLYLVRFLLIIGSIRKKN